MSSLIFDVDTASSFPAMAEPAFAEKKAADFLKHVSGTPKLAGVTPASRLEIRPAPETAPFGISQLDALTGGLPRGCFTEICGPDSSGRTSVLLAALAAATRREEVCTLIDASDAFHPQSAAAAGIHMERLLWIRCGANAHSSWARKRRKPASLEEWERQRMEDPVEQALRAADLLLQSSGFGMVAIDLAGVPVKMARRIPLTTWFRFRRTVENTPTILLVIGEQSCAQSCASLSLNLKNRPSSVTDRQQKPVRSGRFPVLSETPTSNRNGRLHHDGKSVKLSHTELLTGIEIRAEILHSRSERKPAQSASSLKTKTVWTA